MKEGKLRVATCQFAVSKNILRNSKYIQNFMQKSKSKRADIVHFSECALSGYAGSDLESLKNFDWETLWSETRKIMKLAAKLKIWTVLGSTHFISPNIKPHNSLYLINPQGKIVDRYDKRFCMERDLQHYTPGDHLVFFEINGVKCTLLICYDLRFPELYRALKKKKVDCILQSFYNARLPQRTIHTDIMRQTMQCRAATNYFWVSMSNSCSYYCAYPSCVIQPDGKIIKELNFHGPGIMINTIDTKKVLYDASGPFRGQAMKGQLYTGKPTGHARSKNRKILEAN